MEIIYVIGIFCIIQILINFIDHGSWETRPKKKK